RDVGKPRNLPDATSKGLDHRLVCGLFLESEKVLLSGIRGCTPRRVAPEAVHAGNLRWINLRQVVSEDVSVHVEDRKIEEDFDRTHPSGCLDYAPVKMKTI